MATREAKAIEVLKAGGCFRYALERNFRGHEKFVMRLRTAGGAVVKGIGYATQRAFLEAGMLVRRECARSSTWPQEWVLAAGALPAPAAMAA
jgi:hypothetical protein